MSTYDPNNVAHVIGQLIGRRMKSFARYLGVITVIDKTTCCSVTSFRVYQVGDLRVGECMLCWATIAEEPADER